MATITGLTADRMLEIEAASVIDGEIVDGNLILTKHDGTTIDAGPVVGPPGPIGPEGAGAIPGEVKMWPGDVLPVEATYGKWVWADGAYYPVDSHPKAAAHIHPRWRTMDGAFSDPGAGNFRVPDMRGMSPAGMDQMPGGARANRMTRADAIIIARKTGRETYDLKIGEMPLHSHRADGQGGPGQTGTGGYSAGSDRSLDHLHSNFHDHAIGLRGGDLAQGYGAALGGAAAMADVGGGGQSAPVKMSNGYTGAMDRSYDHLHSINPNGNNGAHENVQPTIMVPYIVYLDVV